MTKFAKTGLLAVAAVCALALAACGKSDKEEPGVSATSTDILSFIPADTPYVLVTLESAPEELSDKLEPQVDAILDAYKVIIRETLNTKAAELPEDSEEREFFEQATPVLEEFMTILSVDGMKSIGIDRESRFALYGNGLLPVMRISLTDPELFEDAIERIEEKAGEPMETATAKGQSYRYIGSEDGKVVIGVFGDYAVVAPVPAVFDESQVARVVGLELPQQNIGQSGELAALAKEFGFTNHMLGLVNSQRIAAPFLETPMGLNADLLALGDFDASAISDVCKDEIRDMVGLVPRLVTGYTSVTADRMDASMIVELRSDIADGLSKLTAAVPGLGGDAGGLFAFGMSMNVKEMRDFYAAQLDALESDPFECEYFQEMQAGMMAGRAALNQPVPPIVYDVRGFVAVVDDVSGMALGTGRPPENIDASVLLAVDNAPALLQLGAMFSPELAALNLQPDGKPVEFTPRQLGGMVDTTFVALEQNALALSVGEGAESEVTRLLDADAADPAPFMSMSLDAERYYSFIGEAMMLDPNAEEDLGPEAQQAMSDLMVALGKLYDRIIMDIHLTKRGVEIDSVVTLGD